MTRLLSLDPGKNSGIALGHYDDSAPYTLVDRWQQHDGLEGFIYWWENERPLFDVIVVERFVLDPSNQFTADLTPKEIEGALKALWRGPIVWQLRGDKGALCGYPPSAKTKAQRQRVRNLWLDRFGLFVPGEDNQDSADAIVHSLVYLKRQRHLPTMKRYWPPSGARLAA